MPIPSRDHRGPALLVCVLLLTTAAAGLSAQAGWSRFRGPNGSGVVETTELPATFGPATNVVWKTALPPGHSSPVLSRDRVYVTASETTLSTIALDRASGRVLWRRDRERRHTLPVDKRNHPASPSPVVDGDNVYAFFQDFGLVAYDAAGQERWNLPLGPFNNAYGMGASPIVVGDLVILVCDQSAGSFMLAIDKESGRVRWKVDRPEAKTGHSTPIVYQPAGSAPQLLVPGSFSLVAYSLADGTKLWWVNGLAFEMKATPVIAGDLVYIHGTSTAQFQDSYEGKVPAFADLSAANDKNRDGRFAPDEIPDVLAKRWIKLMDLDGDGHLNPDEWAYYQSARRSQGGLWAFRLGGTGDMTETNRVWHYTRAVPQLPSPLLYRDVLYIVNDGGIMTALDPATGKALTQTRLRGAVDAFYASPVAADGKIFVVSESGTVVVVKADGQLSVLALNELDDLAYATPAIADGRIYVRTRNTLYCFGLAR